MTMTQWYNYQRLIAHYEEEKSNNHIMAAGSFAMMGLMFLIMILLASMGILIWWVVIIPIFTFFYLGIIGMTNAAYARNAIEDIKWRMI